MANGRNRNFASTGVGECFPGENGTEKGVGQLERQFDCAGVKDGDFTGAPFGRALKNGYQVAAVRQG